MLDSNEIRKRWASAHDAKVEELDRIEKAYLWLYEFEKHLKIGEEGNMIYRFPEVFGYVMRKYNGLIEVLPEARARGNGDGAIGLQSCVEHFSRISNWDKTKMEVLADTSAFGSGCYATLPVIYKKKTRDGKEIVKYRGLGTERVDWRMLFPAAGYKSLHDHTGENQLPYVFRKRIYHMDTFRNKFSGPMYKNVDQVKPTAWGDANVWFDKDFTTTHENEETSTTNDFVTLLEYWDEINDRLQMFGTGGVEIYDCKEGIPLSHKEHPFHQYKNSPRHDSINGIGEVELNMPYNLFRERNLNLGIKGMELTIQPSMFVSGNINFNAEENELEPGAIFEVRGVDGKLSDNIMPMTMPSGLSGDVFQMIQLIENSRISVTADDTTALYSNPNQLATQTLAKMQTMNKTIDGVTKRNILEAEFYAVKQLVSYINNEFAEPYKDGKDTKYSKVSISGYDPVQENKDSEVSFVRGHGASGKFSLNKATAKMMEDEEIEVIPAKQDEELKRDRTEKLMMLINTVMSTIAALAQYRPELIPEVLGNMNVPDLIKITAKNLGLDSELKEVFPVIARDKEDLDAVDSEHDQIMAGIVPEIRKDEDSLEELPKHLQFKDSKFFEKNANKKAKEAMNKHIIKTMQNVQLQKSVPVASKQKGLGDTEGGIDPRILQGTAPMVEGKANTGGARVPLQEEKGKMERGIPGRTA